MTVCATEPEVTVAKFHTKSIVPVTAQCNSDVIARAYYALVVRTGERGILSPLDPDVGQKALVPVLLVPAFGVGRIEIVDGLMTAITDV